MGCKDACSESEWALFFCRSRGFRSADENDFAEQAVLLRANLLPLDQFEDGEKRDDDFDACLRAVEQLSESHVGLLLGQRGNAHDFLLDGDREGDGERALRQGRANSQSALQRVDQVCGGDAFESPESWSRTRGRGKAWIRAQPFLLPLAQERGGALEQFVLAQLPYQRVGGIFLLLWRRLFWLWQQQARFDKNQFCGDNEIVRQLCQFDVTGLADQFEVLIGDSGKRDARNVHLAMLDEMQKQVERTLEFRKMERMHFRLPVG